MPAFNEQDRIGPALDSIVAHLDSGALDALVGDSWQIIVVDDGSADGTCALVEAHAQRRAGIELIRFDSNRGKGAAVRAGMLAATGAYRLFTDADQSAPIEDAARLLVPLVQGEADVACGSRRDPSRPPDVPQPTGRRLAASLWTALARLLVVRGVRDTQCGFKCLTAEATETVFRRLSADGPTFDVEMLALCGLENLRVAEVGVTWRHHPESRIRYDLARSLDVFVELWRIRRRLRLRRRVTLRSG